MSNNCIIIKTQAANLKKVERPGKATLFFNEQSAALEIGEDFPKPFTLTLDDGQKPYPPGRYTIDASALAIGDYGRLTVARSIKLIPLPGVVASAPAQR